MIGGRTTLIAHLGYPTDTFTSPSICNPWFEKNGFDAAVVPMSAKSEGYPELFRALFSLNNLRGALVTMPHKVKTMDLVDEVSPAAAIAGATNAVVKRQDGSLLADQFDGIGFVRAILRKGFDPKGKRVLIIGTGGVGSAIAASLAGPRSLRSDSLIVAAQLLRTSPGVCEPTTRRWRPGSDRGTPAGLTWS